MFCPKIAIQKTTEYGCQGAHKASGTDCYSNYIKWLILKVVKEVEEGFCRKEAGRIYGERIKNYICITTSGIYLLTCAVILGRLSFAKKQTTKYFWFCDFLFSLSCIGFTLQHLFLLKAITY